MTIIQFEDVDFLDVLDVSTESSVARRDSLKDNPYESGPLPVVQSLTDLLDTIQDRGQVCRVDATRLAELSTESSVLRTHIRKYPATMYTSELSQVLYDETVASLESSIVKTMGETLSTVTNFIGEHGSSAINYIKEVFDEDARTNDSIRKTIHLIEFITDAKTMLAKSSVARNVRNDLAHVDEIIHDAYTSKWNGLKESIATPAKDMAILSESIAIPVIEVYPSTMMAIKTLIEEVSKAKTKSDIDAILKQYRTPKVNIDKLKRWVNKHIVKSKIVKTEGVVTELQAIAMTVRSHVKSLENDRQSKIGFKAKDVIQNISDTEWVTTETVALEIMTKAKEVAAQQKSLSADMSRLAKTTIMDNEATQELIPVVLELLSIVRGFGALIDAIGVITIVKRALVNEQLRALSMGVKAVHEIIRNNRTQLTVGEVGELNKLIVTLKSNM